SPVGVAGVKRPAQVALQFGDQLTQAQCVGRSAAKVEDLAGDYIDALKRPLVGVDQVTDPERIANLAAVAEDGERLAERGSNAEPGDPALIFNAKLTSAEDA